VGGTTGRRSRMDAGKGEDVPLPLACPHFCLDRCDRSKEEWHCRSVHNQEQCRSMMDAERTSQERQHLLVATRTSSGKEAGGQGGGRARRWAGKDKGG
ncbi:hypothetical protein CY34DRAFT_804594, partial [Suillus luteus UH-Slu-Lm8-n1]